MLGLPKHMSLVAVLPIGAAGYEAKSAPQAARRERARGEVRPGPLRPEADGSVGPELLSDEGVLEAREALQPSLHGEAGHWVPMSGIA